MRRRWIADEITGDTAALVGDHAAHLSRVLRAQVGQEFDIATGDEVRRGTITTISYDRVEFALGATPRRKQSLNPTAPKITLALAIFKFDRMEWAIEKCTEIGVSRIIPIIARRTDAHLAAAAAKRHDRWQRLVRQASEQSRREAPPVIAAPVELKDLAAEPVLAAGPTRIVLAESLAESKDETRLTAVLQSSSPTTEVVLAIGPEGGWTDSELTCFHDEGWTAASLGHTILRAETAAIVATALALEALR
ncbi:MAG TPA: RsmE family RNA methyltransferase [Terriglobales bacterium]|jgi:16S rRNA (uracil1498-N3)-methyltransferase|nr:RsmE family RNA methyltransferase [Terriglobales bacterium]